MGLYASPRLLPAGDGAVSIELADDISRDANARALTLERLLLEARLPGLVETVPTFRSLLVHYDPARASLDDAGATLARSSRPGGGRAAAAGAPGRAAVLLRRELGLDLEEAAAPARPHRRPSSSGCTRAPITTCTSWASPPGSRTWPGSPRASTIPRLDTPANQDAARQRRDRRHAVPPSTRWRARAASGCSAARRCGSTTPTRRTRSCSAPGDRVRFRPDRPAEYDAIAAAVAAAAPTRPVIA